MVSANRRNIENKQDKRCLAEVTTGTIFRKEIKQQEKRHGVAVGGWREQVLGPRKRSTAKQ